MARLIDDIRITGGFEMPHWIPRRSESEYRQQVTECFNVLKQPGIPVLDITNVADYYYIGTDQEDWGSRHFPNCAPPYETFWAEYQMPSHLRSETHGDIDVSATIKPGRIGVLMDYTPHESGDGWQVICMPFMEVPHSRPVIVTGPLNTWVSHVSANGILDNKYELHVTGKPHEESSKSMVALMHPVFLAVSFMHCKNVVVTDNQPAKKLAKRFRERHGTDPAPYKTLVIEPLKQILRHEGKSDQVGLQRAMHICRGHFKDYRVGKGLFGKYKKLVWQPSLIRGTHGAAPPREVKIKL